MKKLIAIFAVALLVGAAAYAVTVTNRGQVITVQTLEDTITDTVNTNVVTEYSRSTILETGESIDTTIHTPDFAGQLMVWVTSNQVYGAAGFTTNDWVRLDD